MKRLLATALALVLLASIPGPAPDPAVAGKNPCAKIRHSKMVWVKVKRKGKWVKVRRQKVWWTCDPFEAPGPPRLGVIAKEFRFIFSRPYVRSGDLVLQLDNQGGDIHNLRIGPATGGPAFTKVENTAPRQQTTVEVPLTPGRYRLWCSLPGHARQGMKAVLKVR